MLPFWSVVLTKPAHAFTKLVFKWSFLCIDGWIDPTGTMIKYEARGIGPAEENIKLELESSYKPVRIFLFKTGVNNMEIGNGLEGSWKARFVLLKEEYGRRRKWNSEK